MQQHVRDHHKPQKDQKLNRDQVEYFGFPQGPESLRKVADALVGLRGRHGRDRERQAAVEEGAAKRHHHRLDACEGHEKPAERAAYPGHDHADQAGDKDVHAGIAPQHAYQDAGQADDGPCLDIHPARDQDEGNKQRDDRHRNKLVQAAKQARQVQKLAVHRAEHRDLKRDQQKQCPLPAKKYLFEFIHRLLSP